MFKLENSPLTLSGIYKEGWKLYKSSLQHVILWSFILSIIHIMPYIFGFVFFYHHNMAGHLVFSWWVLLIIVTLLIAEAYFVAVLFYTMYLNATEQKIDQAIAVKRGTSTLLKMYFAAIIFYVAVLVGILLFLLPAVFFAIILSMFLPFIVIEGRSVYSAFESSARLVWGYWWQTFFVLVVPYLLVYLIRNLFKITPWGGEWMQLIDVVIISLVMPYFYAVLLVQYNNLKVIKSLPEPISQRPRTAVRP